MGGGESRHGGGEEHSHIAHSSGHHVATAAPAARRSGHDELRHHEDASHRHPWGRVDKDPGSPPEVPSPLHLTAIDGGAWGTADLAGANIAAPPPLSTGFHLLVCRYMHFLHGEIAAMSPPRAPPPPPLVPLMAMASADTANLRGGAERTTASKPPSAELAVTAAASKLEATPAPAARGTSTPKRTKALSRRPASNFSKY